MEPFFFFPVLIFIMFGLTLYSLKRATDARTELADIVLNEEGSSLAYAVWFPVHYSSKKYFQKTWKSFVWEKSGILFLDKDLAVFVPYDQHDPSIAFDLKSPVYWVGRKLWPHGRWCWFSLASNGDKHYFTSETGTFVFSSKRKTEEIYRKVKHYSQ